MSVNSESVVTAEAEAKAAPAAALRRRRRVVLIGDVGVVDGRYHLGDEAMLGAAVQQLRERGDVEITVLSRNPADTAARYGVESVPGFGGTFPAGAGDDAHWLELEHLLSLARDSDDQGAHPSSSRAALDSSAAPAIAAIRSADAIIISGGGNLNSQWPNLMFERLAVSELASEFGIDLVLSSQSIGPRVDHPHQGPLARILSIARVVGVRERGSLATLSRLGLSSGNIIHTPDDASALFFDAETGPTSLFPSGDFVAATFARHSGIATPEAHIAGARTVIEELASTTGLPVLLIAHEGSLGSGPESGDVRFHQEIAIGLPHIDVSVLPLADAGATKGITGRAKLVVSMRYHQIVDALGLHVPCLGISVDSYCENKLGGALRDAGLGAFSVTTTGVSSGSFGAVLAEAWLRRSEISEHLAGLTDARQQRLSRWWDLVCNGQGVAVADGFEEWAVAEFPTDQAAGAANVRRERLWFLAASEQFDRLRAEIDAGQRALRHDEREAVFDYRLAEVHAENELLRERNENLEAALAASRELLTRLGDPLFAKTLAPGIGAGGEAADESQFKALLGTRTLRWTRAPRKLYRGFRTGFTDWDVLG